MRLEDVRGIARAQSATRAVIHDVAAGLTPGDTERSVADRIEAGLTRRGVRCWLHTPYAWFGERTRFSGFHHWEPDALPTERRLGEGEPYILDAAPFVDGHPCDYALSGRLGTEPGPPEMIALLRGLKASIVGMARDAASGDGLFGQVSEAVERSGFEVVHSLYPAAVLGHSLVGLPRWLQRLPRIGRGFQLPLIAGYALALARHRLAGAPYPFINDLPSGAPAGLYAVEPHVARGDVGVKFESILLVDGDETRWLDPELYGDASP
jgi:hypothetical protein